MNPMTSLGHGSENIRVSIWVPGPKYMQVARVILVNPTNFTPRLISSRALAVLPFESSLGTKLSRVVSIPNLQFRARKIATLLAIKKVPMSVGESMRAKMVDIKNPITPVVTFTAKDQMPPCRRYLWIGFLFTLKHLSTTFFLTYEGILPQFFSKFSFLVLSLFNVVGPKK